MDVIKTVYTKRLPKRDWESFIESIANSFKPASSSDCAQDYFGTIEIFDDGICVRFDPDRARGFGATRNVIEITYKKIKTSSDWCHWLIKPAYQIEDTPANRKLLEKVYGNKRI